MIHSHLYARKPGTPVFSAPVEDGKPVQFIQRGNWLGVLSRKDNWIQVIGINFEGWVKSEDVEERPPLSLHISWSPGKPIEYISSVA